MDDPKPQNFNIVRRHDMTPTEVLETFRGALRGMTKHYLVAGHMAYMAKNKEMFLKWGYSTYREFAEKEGGSYQRTEKFRRLWKRIVKDAGIRPQEFSTVEVSKANHISRVVNRDNYDYWISKASSLNCSQLLLLVKEEENRRAGKVRNVVFVEADAAPKKPERNPDSFEREPEEGSYTNRETPDTPEPGPTKMSFFLFPEQLEIVQAALDKSAIEAESEKPGHLLALMSTFYLASRAGKSDGYEAWVEFILKKLELAVGGRMLWFKKPEDVPEELQYIFD